MSVLRQTFLFVCLSAALLDISKNTLIFDSNFTVALNTELF